MYLATKSDARNALTEFLPKSGREYAVGRNYDRGPDREATVSKLSPYIRIRLLPEWEVAEAVLEAHNASSASKFIDEVCWRSYWKGWLQLRPQIWEDYLEERSTLNQTFENDRRYLDAIEARSGIDCFDAWTRELIETNYLHNHARMWYASIWTHTLQLPWQLGAHWFLRHLLDGDPASNTLSWRWVAGIQTRGKAYLARPDNIRKYTNGRFEVRTDLASEAIPLEADLPPGPKPLQDLPRPTSDLKLGLLITEEDLSAQDWIQENHSIEAVASYFPFSEYAELGICQKVVDFRKEALSKIQCDGIFGDVASLVDWTRRNQLDAMIMPEPTTGHWPQIVAKLRASLEAKEIELFTARHWWDETLFPHATHGFFRFKKSIPEAIDRLRA